MEFTAKLLTAYPPESGMSNANGKEWHKQAVLFETPDRYPKKIRVEFWNDNINKLQGFQLNQLCTVSINIESREYNGRWYHNVTAYDIRPAVQQQPAISTPMPGSLPATPAAPVATAPARPASNANLFAPAPSAGSYTDSMVADDDLPF